MKKIALNQVLDDCITQLQSGDYAVDDCFREHSQYREDLEPLLIVAAEARDRISIPEPRAEYLDQSKARIVNQVKASRRKTQESRPPRPRSSHRILRPAFVLAGIVLVLALMVSGVGVVSASAGTIPGDALYPVKRGFEEARLVLTLNPESDQNILLDIADERLAETEKALEAGRDGDAEAAIRGYQETVERILALSGDVYERGNPDSLSRVQNRLEQHQQVLLDVMMEEQHAANEGLENALERSQHGREIIEQIKQGGKPSDLAPGQLKRDTDELKGAGDDVGTGKDKDKTKTPKPKKDKKPTRTP